MYSGLLIILLPLIVGYLIPLRHRPLLVLINRQGNETFVALKLGHA